MLLLLAVLAIELLLLWRGKLEAAQYARWCDERLLRALERAAERSSDPEHLPDAEVPAE